MGRIRRDPIGLAIALAVGIAIGLRALQVVRAFREGGGGLSDGFAQGTTIGWGVAFAFAAALAAWRLAVRPEGVGGPRLAALAGGMVVGAIIGLGLFGAA